jgi:hypothetical protein
MELSYSYIIYNQVVGDSEVPVKLISLAVAERAESRITYWCSDLCNFQFAICNLQTLSYSYKLTRRGL